MKFTRLSTALSLAAALGLSTQSALGEELSVATFQSHCTLQACRSAASLRLPLQSSTNSKTGFSNFLME